MQTLNRHNLDLIAKAVISGQRGYGKPLDRIADTIAGLMTNRLEAAQVPGALRLPKRGRAKVKLPSREARDFLLRRVEKRLASLVLAQITDGRS